jgi:ketopantoate reductase
MKISVLGAGAIGSTLGGLPQHDAPGLEVVLIACGEHGRVLGERGSLLMDGGAHEVRICGSLVPSDVAGSQLVSVSSSRRRPKDLQCWKATEVDYISGEIVRLTATVNTRAPMNAEVVRMVHELEERRDGSFFTRDEAVRRFGQLPTSAVGPP